MAMRSHLRVKIKSLGVEAGLIRLEERRAKANARWERANQQPEEAARTEAERYSLQMHRLRVVRPQARAVLLAYAFMRERDCPEAQGSSRPNFQMISENLKRFGIALDVRNEDDRYDLIRNWIKRTSPPKPPPVVREKKPYVKQEAAQ